VDIGWPLPEGDFSRDLAATSFSFSLRPPWGSAGIAASRSVTDVLSGVALRAISEAVDRVAVVP
jgi:hypothetical protein